MLTVVRHQGGDISLGLTSVQ